MNTICLKFRFSVVSAQMCVVFFALGLLANTLSYAAVCPVSGSDGPSSVGGVVNSYYPGSGTASAGSASITVGSVDTSSGGLSNPIAVGDLLLVIQMQDADISFTNDANYGGSLPGTGYTFLNNSGIYEYVIATNSVGISGGTINLAAPLQNTYRSANYSAGI